MTACQHCTRKTALPLCTPCTHQLADLLAELPWLLHQLDITLTRQDRLNTPGNSTPNHNANPINVGAMELMRSASDTLRQIAVSVAYSRADKQVPALANASPAMTALWLKSNLRAIQNDLDAGQHYTAIKDIVGDTQPGPIHHAINRPDQHLAGPCPTLRGHHRDGTDIRCNHMLWAHHDETFVLCPRCETHIDVEQNRRRAATLRDLLPADVIIDVLDRLGEPVRKETLYGWITAGRLKPQGFLTAHGWAKRRTRPSDPRVYSVTRARALRQRITTM